MERADQQHARGARPLPRSVGTRQRASETSRFIPSRDPKTFSMTRHEQFRARARARVPRRPPAGGVDRSRHAVRGRARDGRRRRAARLRPRAAHDPRRVRDGRRARGAGARRLRRRAVDPRGAAATCPQRRPSTAETFGVRPGDRVAIAMRNLPEYVVTCWGSGTERRDRRAAELVVDDRRARLRAPRPGCTCSSPTTTRAGPYSTAPAPAFERMGACS